MKNIWLSRRFLVPYSSFGASESCFGNPESSFQPTKSITSEFILQIYIKISNYKPAK